MEKMHIRHSMDLTDHDRKIFYSNDRVKMEEIVCLIKIEAIVREEKIEDVKKCINGNRS